MGADLTNQAPLLKSVYGRYMRTKPGGVKKPQSRTARAAGLLLAKREVGSAYHQRVNRRVQGTRPKGGY